MKRKLFRQAFMFVFFMTATTTLSSFTSLQVRGGGDGGESYSFNVPYYG